MDTLSTIVALLKPQAVVATMVHGAGRWGVRYSKFGHPGFAIVLEGQCWLAADGLPSRILEAGDFVFFPATPAFTLASDPKVKPKAIAPAPSDGGMDEVFHGDAQGRPAARLLGGYFAFDPVNASMLLEWLPRIVHIRASDPAIGGMMPLIGLVQREALEKRPGHSLVLTRLAEVILIEALRASPVDADASGLLAGLRDEKLAGALRAIHTRTAQPWSLVSLAREARMSRSSFAERFARVLGITPLDYLLRWRLAVARDLLARGQMNVGETALAVGYESASGFSTAFSRETGESPKKFVERSAQAAGSRDK